MLIANWDVYDLEKCVIASGYPMLPIYHERENKTPTPKDIARARRLAATPTNSGHGNFLKGIIVNFDVVGAIKWWVEAQRYSHFTIVSSMSTMHMSLQMALREACSGVSPVIVEEICRMQQNCVEGRAEWDSFIRSLPVGLEYGARVTTNYLQLKTIYQQRNTHRLPEWAVFCGWILTLPHAEFINPSKEEEQE